MRILIVDDNEDSRKSLEVVLNDLGHSPATARLGQEALDLMEEEYFPLVITDIRMPGMDGLELLERIKSSKKGKRSDVILITGHGDMETAISALRKGAYDYLNKPINARELSALVERCAEHVALVAENKDLRHNFDNKVMEATRDIQVDLDMTRSQLLQATGVGTIVAESPAMKQLVGETEIYHQNPTVPVLIEGETGVGKEILAKLLHFGHGHSTKPFVAINCSAIPSELFESELFGHEPGAYTGSARKGAPGKIEMAGEGTLFLDEVAEMPMSLQPKLLRVLEDRTFYRVGGVKKRRFRARLVCAANRDLDRLVEEGSFRRDLFHRLKVGHLTIPPLRERLEDIEPLARLFLKREAKLKKKPFQDISSAALTVLMGHSWPGNVRELENVIERAVLTSRDVILQPEHIAFISKHSGAAQAGPGEAAVNPGDMDLPDKGLDLQELNDLIIRKALKKFKGNKTLTAQYLGMSRYALHRRLQKE